MSSFRSLAAGILAAVSVLAPPVAEAANWNGFYGGLTGGYATGQFAAQEPPGCFPVCDTFPAFVIPGNGFIGGVFGGYNFDTGQVVLGVEADAMVSTLNGSYVGQPYAFVTTGGELLHLVTVRGRVGLPVGNDGLIYVTGGLAHGKARVGYDANPADREMADHLGYALGVGGEMMVTPTIGVRADYLYVDLGSRQYNLGSGIPLADVKLNSHIFRVGISFKFGG